MFHRYSVSQDLQDWIADSFHWAADQGLFHSGTALVFPDKCFFTAPSH